MVIAELANNWYEKLLVAGTYITRSYDGIANHAPTAVLVKDVSLTAPTKKQAGWVVANITLLPGITYRADELRLGLLLVNPTSTEAVFMDYHANTGFQADANGNLQSVTLALPKGMAPPGHVRVYVLRDVFPAYEKDVMP